MTAVDIKKNLKSMIFSSKTDRSKKALAKKRKGVTLLFGSH